MDVVYIPTAKSKKQYLVIAKEYFLGQLEVRALINTISKAVAKFLWEEVIYKQGVFKQLFINRGLENKDIGAIFIEMYRIYQIVISAYYSQKQGLIEREH